VNSTHSTSAKTLSGKEITTRGDIEAVNTPAMDAHMVTDTVQRSIQSYADERTLDKGVWCANNG